jgi:molecular chaperone GrpE
MDQNDTVQQDSANENGGTQPTVEEQLAQAQAEAAEYRDKWLRAAAEVENMRRRAERDVEETRKYAIAGFARDLLNVADNLRRALASVDPEKVQDEVVRNLLAGVEATERELLSVFERYGMKRVDPMGEKFDHNFHQAMFETESPDKPGGTVTEVLQVGWTLRDRLLRPAMVGVAKSTPAAERVDTTA